MSTPAPARPRRRIAPDPRLLLGLLLVVASVAGVVGVVTAADRRSTLYVTPATLIPGQQIHVADLVERRVALDGADGLYLGRGDIPAGGLVVTQAVAKGQLLPTSSFGSAAGVRSTSLVVQLATRVSGAVVPGASVDLWSASSTSDARAASGEAPDTDPDTDAGAGSVAAPTVLVAGATVVRVLDASGSFASDTKGSSVEVLVPRSRVARLLQAIADGDALALVPAGIPVAGSGSASGSGAGPRS
jgi:hypothetical protein